MLMENGYSCHCIRCSRTCVSDARVLWRLIVYEDIYDKVKDRLVSIYHRITIGDPLEPGTLVGPMIDQAAVDIDAEARKGER